MEIVVVDRAYPIEAVIEYRICVLSRRLVSPETDYRAFYAVVIEKEIIVYIVALICVAAPEPAVTLDTVEIALASIEMERICRDIPYLVDQFVITTESTLVFERNIFIVA